jgi:hypothetical protein
LRNFQKEWEKTHLSASDYSACIRYYRECGVQTEEEYLLKMEVINSGIDVLTKDCTCLREE